MSEPDEIGERVTRLESEVAQARHDAAAARVLAGGADRDVSAMQVELRSHSRSLNALRETQVEQGVELHALRETQVEQRVELHALREEMRGGFSKLAVGQAHITALLTPHIEECGGATD